MKISVVIVTKNRARFLMRLIESLRVNTRLADEIIVVDNASSDDTRSVTLGLMERFPEIKYYFEPLTGISHARNCGIRNAQHEIIAFTDDDCVADIGWLEELYRLHQDYPDVVAVGGRTLSYRPNVVGMAGDFHRTWETLSDICNEFEIDSYDKMLRQKNYMISLATQNISYKKSKIGNVWFDTSLAACEAIDFAWQLYAKDSKSILYSPNAIIYHEYHRRLLRYLTQHLRYGLSCRQLIKKARSNGHLPCRKERRFSEFLARYITFAWSYGKGLHICWYQKIFFMLLIFLRQLIASITTSFICTRIRTAKEKGILFISSPLSERSWHFFPEMPLGLAYLAAAIEKINYRKIGIDYNVERFSRSKLKRIFKRYHIKYVAISCNYGSIENAMMLAKMIKGMVSVPIILGGLPATFLTKEIYLKAPEIDIYVHGEGETAFRQIIEERALDSISGISFVKNGKLFENLGHDAIVDLDDLGLPVRNLFNSKKYWINMFFDRSTLIETSRGCAYNCDFCTQPAKEGRRVRYRSVQMLATELSEISKDRLIKRVTIVDNDFLVNVDHSNAILKMILDKGFNQRFEFFIATRIERLISRGKELRDLLRNANVKTVFVGLESFSEEQIPRIGKIDSIEKVFCVIKEYEEEGIEILPSYMIGHKGENIVQVNCTIDQAIKLNSRNINVNIVTPFPGTPLFDGLKQCGGLKSYDYNLYDGSKQVIHHELNLEKTFVYFYRRYFYRLSYFMVDSIREVFIRLGMVARIMVTDIKWWVGHFVRYSAYRIGK